MCEPCQTPRRDPDVRIPWSKAAGLEKGRVAAGEAIRTAASLPVVRQAVASLEKLLLKAQRDFRLLQGPDIAIAERLQEDLEFARGRLAALDPNATRPATVSPQTPAPAAAATAAAPPPAPAKATNPARGKIFTQNPNPNRLVRPPTANVPFLGGRPVPQP